MPPAALIHPMTPSLPVEVAEAPRRLKVTEHPIDLHPQRDLIIETLARYWLTEESKKPDWKTLYYTLLTSVQEDHPLVLADTEERAIHSLRLYAQRVARNITLTGEFMREALQSSKSDLNLLRRKMALADELQAAVGVALAAGDMRAAASLGRAAEQALASFEATAERYGIIPQPVRRLDVRQANVNLDVKAIFAHTDGKRPLRVDVEP